MKIVIFAGGFGRRLWPISRSSSPKQFEPILGDRSTIQLAVDRVLGLYGAENIFISTNEKFAEIIRQQLPEVPEENVIGEPVRRDLAAAVGLSMVHMLHSGDPEEAVAILWGDNYMHEVAIFQEVLEAAERLVVTDMAQLVFIGESPRFANENLGWIHLGERQGEIDGRGFFKFDGLRYRPDQADCQEMFASQEWVWNTGYFVTKLGYIQQAYQTHQPQMWAKLQQIGETLDRAEYAATLTEVYPLLESISFDDAILTHLDYEGAAVLHAPMGWSDPGTLYALKEALANDGRENVTKGLVLDDESTDCLIYNYEPDKVVTVLGLEGLIVVNTADALLVVHKDNIKQVKQVVEGFVGTDLEKYS